MKKGKKWKKIEAFCIMLIVTLLLIFVRILYQPGTESERGELYTFSNGWYQLKDGKKTELKLPCFVTADKDGQIIDGGKALTTDSMSSVFSGLVGAAPAAVYIESAAGTAAGGKTGLTAITVGVLFLLILFLSPLSYLVPGYATAPALMYVGLLMLSNVAKIDFADFVDAMAGLVTAVFLVLTCNIVTGIMIGFATLVIGRLVSGEWRKLNIGTVVIAVALVTFYAGGWAI